MIFTYCIILLITTYLGSVALSIATQSHDGKPDLWTALIDAWVTTIGIIVGLGVVWVTISGVFLLVS